MATINIGNLAFNHKGDYASGTAYVKNDVVYYSTNGNAYIAKQATTGNAPTNATYWNQFAQGSGGIWNAGLSLGSAGQVVKVNSGGSALEFGSVSSDFVKIASTQNDSLGAGSVTFQSAFDNTTYHSYQLHWVASTDSGNDFKMRLLNSSNNVLTGSNDYRRAGGQQYRYYTDNSNDNTSSWSDADGTNAIHVTGWNGSGNSNQTQSGVINFLMPKPNSSTIFHNIRLESGGYSTGNWLYNSHAQWLYTGNNVVTGFIMYLDAGNFARCYLNLYGLKK